MRYYNKEAMQFHTHQLQNNIIPASSRKLVLTCRLPHPRQPNPALASHDQNHQKPEPARVIAILGSDKTGSPLALPFLPPPASSPRLAPCALALWAGCCQLSKYINLIGMQRNVQLPFWPKILHFCDFGVEIKDCVCLWDA